MLFSGKENVFMCLVVFQKMFRKIFSDICLCSWKYHRKHIFYLLLTFSHIFSVTKQLYNIIYFSKYKQNPEKIDWRDCDRAKIEAEIAIGATAPAGDVGGAMRWPRSREASIAIAIERRSTHRMKIKAEIVIGATVPADDVDRRWCRDRFSLSLSSIFQGQKYFEVKIETENHFRCFGSQIQSTGNAFFRCFGSQIQSTGNAFQFD